MSFAYRTPQLLIGTRTTPGNPGDRSTTAVSVAATTVTYSNVSYATGQSAQVSLHLAVTAGTPTGTFSVQQTNDPKLADLGEVTGQFASAQTQLCRWAEVATAAVAAGVIAGSPAGSPNDLIVSIQNGSLATRVVYTNASGTGSIVAYGFSVGN